MKVKHFLSANTIFIKLYTIPHSRKVPKDWDCRCLSCSWHSFVQDFLSRWWFLCHCMCRLSWWRWGRSTSSLRTWSFTTRSWTVGSSVVLWTSPRTWDKSSTSSQIRQGRLQKTRWYSGAAPSWGLNTVTMRTVCLDTVF